ncbi:RHS repeat-associated core domain-containing protein [Gayadomonas joobiniege]|uniref:RHS repeat-associated core domain-containing protein n=1 Tax=Gayadomonas joobiniege TaxID=1234606 RepID=UPI0012DFABE2|nr:RHS repeat-associated core domain-containing protein [Gayadomonas joobiniege]
MAIAKGSRVYMVYGDHLGRPQVIYNLTDLGNASPQPVWRARNFAFNRKVVMQNSNFGEMNIGFPGQYYDSESDLWYNWHRYYDPALGQYISSDPIKLAGGINTYAYVGGNPVMNVDPTGLVSILLDGGASGIVGGGGDGGLGIWFTSGGDQGDIDAGILANGGGGTGFDISAGFNATFLLGGRENIDGTTISTTGDFLGLSISSHINPQTKEWTGFSLGIDVTGIPGYKVTANNTETYSIRDFLNRKLNSPHSPRPNSGRPKHLLQCPTR